MLPATSEQGKPPIIQRDRDRARNAIQAISKGHTTTMAAQVAGVSRRTIYSWIEKGQEIQRMQEEAPDMLPLTPFDDDYIWFIERWEKAEYKRKAELLKRIDEAGEKTWQANAWLLERLNPEEFSSKREVRVSQGRSDKAFRLNMGHGEVKDADYTIVEDSDDES